MDGPQATAVPHAAVGDATHYSEEWDRDVYLSAPSVLPGAAGLEHWDYVTNDHLSNVWRNGYNEGCWYVYSSVTLCKAVDSVLDWNHTGPACVMVSAQEAGLAEDDVCE